VEGDVADTEQAGRPFYARSWALDGIEILRSGKGGDGRTVEAYATPFDVLTEITDKHGHYNERIHRSAFTRTLSHGIDRVGVYYHHGMTLHGTPSDLGSVPIGSPVEIRPDGRGLRTVTRYNMTPLADAVLAAIDNGDIRGYSFRGPIFKSNPQRIPRARPGAPLPTVTRMELGLIEYGPTPTPAYADAGIMAVRSLLEDFLHRAHPASATPDEDSETPATPDPGLGTEDPPEGHSARLDLLRLRAAVRDRGI
jgi:HK97 family phage prohead protease